MPGSHTDLHAVHFDSPSKEKLKPVTHEIILVPPEHALPAGQTLQTLLVKFVHVVVSYVPFLQVALHGRQLDCPVVE